MDVDLGGRNAVEQVERARRRRVLAGNNAQGKHRFQRFVLPPVLTLAGGGCRFRPAYLLQLGYDCIVAQARPLNARFLRRQS